MRRRLKSVSAHIKEHVHRFLLSTRPRTLKFEISVLYTLILGLILIVFTAVFYFILARTLYQELDTELQLKAEGIHQNIRSYLDMRGETPESLVYAAEKTIKHEDALRRWWYIGFERRWFKQIDELDLRQEYVNFANADGTSIIHSEKLSPDLIRLFQEHMPPANGHFVFRNIIYQGQRIRVIDWPFSFNDQTRYVIQVGMPILPILQLLQDWMWSIILSIPVILLLTNFVGRMLASRILRPVHTIATTAKQISDEDLSARVSSMHYYEEIDYLIDAFNDMIARLEKSFRHISTFSSHVAHELKTPLTILRGEAELALMEKRTPEEYREALKISLDEINQMLKIVEDLLLLTRLDYQQGGFKFERINFCEFFAEIFEQAHLLAASRHIDLKLDAPQGPCYVKADQTHLRRLFFNLVDNAIKFTPKGGSIDLRLRLDDGMAVASVSDTGEGIPPEHIERIFERFYRIGNHEAGAGLGLSIAQSIAKIHKGFIRVQSQPGKGATLTVYLPLTTDIKA